MYLRPMRPASSWQSMGSGRSHRDARLMPCAPWLDRALDDAGIACGALNSVADLAVHPALRMVPCPTPTGTAHVVAPALEFDGGGAPYNAVPALGEHSEAIRREFGAE